MTLGEYIGAGSTVTKLLWHFEGNCNDSSGNGNNGSVTSVSFSQANGKFNQGGGFTSSSYVSVGAGVYDITQPWTFSCIIKTSITNLAGIFFRGNSVETSQAGIQSNGGAMRFNMRNSGDQACDGTIAINDGNPHRVVITKSGTGATGVITIYVDGKFDATRTCTNLSNINYSNFTGRLGDSGNTTYSFTGNLDEFRMDLSTWSAEEVKRDYTNFKGRFGIV